MYELSILIFVVLWQCIMHSFTLVFILHLYICIYLYKKDNPHTMYPMKIEEYLYHMIKHIGSFRGIL